MGHTLERYIAQRGSRRGYGMSNGRLARRRRTYSAAAGDETDMVIAKLVQANERITKASAEMRTLNYQLRQMAPTNRASGEIIVSLGRIEDDSEAVSSSLAKLRRVLDSGVGLSHGRTRARRRQRAYAAAAPNPAQLRDAQNAMDLAVDEFKAYVEDNWEELVNSNKDSKVERVEQILEKALQAINSLNSL